MTGWEIVGLVLLGLLVYVCIVGLLEKAGATPFISQRTAGNRARLRRATTLKEVDYCAPLIHGGPTDEELAAAFERSFLQDLEKCAFNGDTKGVEKIYRDWRWRTRGNARVSAAAIEACCRKYLTQARSVRGLEPDKIQYSEEIPWDDDGTWRQEKKKW